MKELFSTWLIKVKAWFTFECKYLHVVNFDYKCQINFPIFQGFSFPLFEGAFIPLDLGNVFKRKNLSGI